MVKSLRLCWNPVLDEFRLNVIPTPARSKSTKRTLLSDLNKVFDPIDIHDRWMSFHKDLEKLQNVSIPRKVLPKPNEFQIHGFCDASQEAYGACIYIRSRCSENTWQVRLLYARSSVAPTNGSTIPHVELNGALVLAQLLQKLADAWEIDRHKCNLWTDSTSLQMHQWNYVRTDKNPADMISRGTNVTEISASNLWWNGPDWKKKYLIQFALVGVQSNQELVQHYSSWSRLQRATAWLKRLVEYLRTRRVPSEVHLSVRELQAAGVCILKQVQAECFLDELRSLESQRALNLKSKLKSLCLFIKDGLILVGGRLNNSGVLPQVIPPPTDLDKVFRMIDEIM
ncbi:uncharacterized protein LOC103309188 [Acyrthosiphon pisum]|uniref:Uncharacterized protein n=1 Tax=Acyrthosiphon pisum TaxID=7029 RepID=A0A8R2B5A9_ACYPI|nr:uncharacterized protein LOC103309188 [Acyrthosiphon pisum]|eukprot:XP_008182259.1 PREDICTED: uncharacterized protein LOC103309188 [Acyrthosiphon pisum]